MLELLDKTDLSSVDLKGRASWSLAGTTRNKEFFDIIQINKNQECYGEKSHSRISLIR
jgi:hypothetical protein